MHLINARSLLLEDFVGHLDAPPYAILSHTWQDGEVTYDEFVNSHDVAEKKAGFQKIQYLCTQALEDDLEYAWCDTCCIDKSSSAELSEAINSMFVWYQTAQVCYVYLSDVPKESEPLRDDDMNATESIWHELSLKHFKESRWFSRAWTLQELLAPLDIAFYTAGWKLFARLTDVLQIASDRTNIHVDFLLHVKRLEDASIAQRMSWAAGRKATRIEDEAYSLLGLFDVNMPLLYGEGNKAFYRLQKAITEQSTDHTIFAWHWSRWKCRLPHAAMSSAVFAPNTDGFMGLHDLVPWASNEYVVPFDLNNLGLHLTAPLVEVDRAQSYYLAVLNCHCERNTWEAMGLRLKRMSDTSVFAKTGGGLYTISTHGQQDLYTVPQAVPVAKNVAMGATLTAVVISHRSTMEWFYHREVGAGPSTKASFHLQVRFASDTKLRVLDAWPRSEWNIQNRVFRSSAARLSWCALVLQYVGSVGEEAVPFLLVVMPDVNAGTDDQMMGFLPYSDLQDFKRVGDVLRRGGQDDPWLRGELLNDFTIEQRSPTGTLVVRTQTVEASNVVIAYVEPGGRKRNRSAEGRAQFSLNSRRTEPSNALLEMDVDGGETLNWLYPPTKKIFHNKMPAKFLTEEEVTLSLKLHRSC